MLAGCLDSARDVADEIVLVDTGSQDRTMEVARRYGARVYERPWDDDFAAPRNEALAHARGDYILQLDADERLARGARHGLRRALRGDGLHLGLLRLHNASRADAPHNRVVSGELRLGNVLWVPRLARRTPELRYEGVIHEGVDECLLRKGVHPRAVEVDIVHLGSAPDLRERRQKLCRNLALLEKRCQLEPRSITPFGFLAMELFEAGRLSEAQRVADQGWSLLGEQPAYRSALLVANVRAVMALRQGDADRALETAQRFREREGVRADLEHHRGMALLLLALRSPPGDPARAARLEQAIEAFREAMAPRPGEQNSAIAGVGSWATTTRLGDTLLAAGRFREADSAFATALAASPAFAEARLGLAEVQLEAGDAAGCLATVEPLLGPAPDGWLLAAAAAHALGADDDARLLFTRAWERFREGGYRAPHRRERHNALAAALAAPPHLPSVARIA